jgi:hypothetical protein
MSTKKIYFMFERIVYMRLHLHGNFIKRIAALDDFEKFYAALWVISGIKHKKRFKNGASILKIAKQFPHDTRPIDIYKIGYIQALVDLKYPLRYKNKP